MHRELRNGWSSRPEQQLSGGQNGKRKKKTGVIKRGMAYFLTFLMLVGNVQTVAYAEESARNLAGSIHREEAIGGSTTEGAQGGNRFFFIRRHAGGNRFIFFCRRTGGKKRLSFRRRRGIFFGDKNREEQRYGRHGNDGGRRKGRRKGQPSCGHVHGEPSRRRYRYRVL